MLTQIILRWKKFRSPKTFLFTLFSLISLIFSSQPLVDCRCFHGGQPHPAVHILPVGCFKEQPSSWGTSTDTSSGDEPHSRPSGDHPQAPVTWKHPHICWLSAELFMGVWTFLGSRCHPGEPDVHALWSCTRCSAVWESRAAAESSWALHWPVWHQTSRGAHTSAQPRGTSVYDRSCL